MAATWRNYPGGSMMGGSLSYGWVTGGASAPGWMRGGALPAAMMGPGTDAAGVMGRLVAAAPGPRVSAAEATRLGNDVPAGSSTNCRVAKLLLPRQLAGAGTAGGGATGVTMPGPGRNRLPIIGRTSRSSPSQPALRQARIRTTETIA